MKYLNIPALLVLSGLATVSVAQDAIPMSFNEVDRDRDGLLSIDEAEIALPELGISDMNGDGLVNQAEAEAAVPGLTFDSDGGDKTTLLIGEREYSQLAQVVRDAASF